MRGVVNRPNSFWVRPDLSWLEAVGGHGAFRELIVLPCELNTT